MPYEYDKLTEPGALRLIVIQPDHDIDAPVQCSLISTTLRACHEDLVEKYTALSYVWGVASQRKEIFVDGVPLDITASLDLALRHIRQPDKIIRIWADGICINQQDVFEKNTQVAQMGLVYEIANHTIIFLGPATKQSQAFIQAINSLPFQSSSSDWETKVSATLGHKGFTDLLSYPWFTRVWTLQELVLSADPWIQCGSLRYRWDVLAKYIPRRLTSAMEDGMQPLRDMNNFRTGSLTNRYANKNQAFWAAEEEAAEALLLILHSRRGMGATDPRDFIYAHLGMISKKIQEIVIIDYTRSCSATYIGIARQALSWMPNLDILQLVGTQSETRLPGGLPSWVPDWSQSIQRPPPGNFVLGSEGAPKTWDGHRYRLLHANSTLLVVPVNPLGTVEFIIPPASTDQHVEPTSAGSGPTNLKRGNLSDKDIKVQDTLMYFFGLMLARTWGDDAKASVMEQKDDQAQYFDSISQGTIVREVAEAILGMQDGWLSPFFKDAILSDDAEQKLPPKIRKIMETLLRLTNLHLLYFPSHIALLSTGALTRIPENVCVGDECFVDLGAGIGYGGRSTTTMFVRRDVDFCMSDDDLAAAAKLSVQSHSEEGTEVLLHILGPLRFLMRGEFPHLPSLKEVSHESWFPEHGREWKLGLGVVLLS